MVAKITLVGNLGVEPETRYTGEGRPMVTCRVASNYRARDAETREWVDKTNWYRVTAFGRLAERMVEQTGDGRLGKGTRIIVFGRLEASAYMDRNNQPQPSLDVVADDIILADSRGREGDEAMGDRDHGSASATPRGGSRGPSRADARTGAGQPKVEEDLEDLPF
jgi:single-strand DNA-binding protein